MVLEYKSAQSPPLSLDQNNAGQSTLWRLPERIGSSQQASPESNGIGSRISRIGMN